LVEQVLAHLQERLRAETASGAVAEAQGANAPDTPAVTELLSYDEWIVRHTVESWAEAPLKLGPGATLLISG